MRRWILAAVLGLAVAGCGDDGSKQYEGTASQAYQVYGACAQCHTGTAERMAARGGHYDLSIKCESCHEDLRPNDPGPGHRSVPACADCHTSQATHHDPASAPQEQCLTCHTPHGSTNLALVRQRITIPSGSRKDITFTSLSGQADDSYVSLTRPGTGVCEVCHANTDFYRADGTGAEHFTFPCQTCHTHANGFSPP